MVKCAAWSPCVYVWGQCAKCVVSKALSTPAETHDLRARTHKRRLSRPGLEVPGSQECARRFLCIFHIKSSLGTALEAAGTAAVRGKPEARK